MATEYIGMEKALPMFVLGGSCLCVTTIVFGILCGHMLRARRRIERLERENDEKQQQYPVNLIQSHSQNTLPLPISTINNTNQSAAVLSSATDIHDYRSSSSRAIVAHHSTFKWHPCHHFPDKRIVEL